MSATPKKRKARGGVKPGDLEVLWRDLPALARHLGRSEDEQRRAAHTQAELAKGIAMTAKFPDEKDRQEWLSQIEAARWRVAEEMLWWAAWGETFDRREADVRSGKIREVRATMGMSWKPNTNVVQASVGMPWRRRVCDLLEHPGIKEGVDSALFPILLDLVKAALDDQAEAYRLRDKPDAEAIQARHVRDESSSAPEGMEGIVKRLEQYRDAKHAEGRTKMTSGNARKTRATDKKDSDGVRASKSTAEQEASAKSAWQKHLKKKDAVVALKKSESIGKTRAYDLLAPFDWKLPLSDRVS